MRHYKISFKDSGNPQVYKMEGKYEYSTMTTIYLIYRIDPALRSIGKCITENNMNSMKQNDKDKANMHSN